MADLPAIGLRVPQYGSSWDAIRDAALRIEALGFDSLWVNDHLQSPGRVKRDPTFDAFTTLAAIAPLTERVRLGTVVMSASYRPPPVAAKMATVIDVISGGRFILGLGSGSNVPEHRAYGIPFPAPAERTERLSAALTTIRAMFRGEEGAPPNVPPSPRPGGPPIWLAAHKPRLLRMAGERADGIVAAFVGPGEAGRRLRVAREARPEALPPLSCCLYTFVLPVPSRAEALDWVRAEAATLGSAPGPYLRWLAGTGIVAAPDDLRATLAAHAGAGVTHAALVLPSRVPPEVIDALAEAVLAPAA
ncbi:MAG TPA: LLM class flavin-dependent oxidoreductase [Miltoncostaeaceae bacterium]|jgi:alkanesulfonate monooxygenase SsuD/methylene tetrahydromethanopterin reductase-like flavin-dependent oxidoreductase (luciferase family)|nr:LLM class flavin-dependent oxidoreductase [Miltoncostaeaceae bacterium]